MPNYTDYQGNTFNTIDLPVEGDPITQQTGEYLAQNDRLLLSSKAAHLPGLCAGAVEAAQESGGAFACWLVLQAGYNATPVAYQNYLNIFSEVFDDGGFKNRMIHITGWCRQVASSAAAALCLPGEANDYSVFGDGDGSTPDIRGAFYSGAGDDGSGNYRYEKDASGYTLNFWVGDADGDHEGDLRLSFVEKESAGSWLVLYMTAEFGPKMTKA